MNTATHCNAHCNNALQCTATHSSLARQVARMNTDVILANFEMESEDERRLRAAHVCVCVYVGVCS